MESKPTEPGDAAAAADFELPIAGFTGTPEEIERQWFEQVYRGRGDSMKQLTWRAILMGSMLGGVLSLTNIYIGLKSGWATVSYTHLDVYKRQVCYYPKKRV